MAIVIQRSFCPAGCAPPMGGYDDLQDTCPYCGAQLEWRLDKDAMRAVEELRKQRRKEKTNEEVP